MKKLLMIAALFVMTGASGAFADTLGDAKSAGLVGEQPNGYLAAVITPSAETQQLIDTINTKRKIEYQKIAAKNGQSLEVVEKLAAAKVIERTEPGRYIRDTQGNWVKK